MYSLACVEALSSHGALTAIDFLMGEYKHLPEGEAKRIGRVLAIDWNKVDFDQFRMRPRRVGFRILQVSMPSP